MDNAICAILVPAGHYIEPHCALSLGQLESMGYAVSRLYGFSQVDVARNRLAADALAEGFKELMWIDSDVAFDPNSVDRLRSHGLPVCCGIYPKKVEKEISSELMPGTTRIAFGQNGGLIEIRRAAAGFLHTRREVYEELQRQGLPLCRSSGASIVPFFLPMVVEENGGYRYLGEDFAFSERLRRAGFRIVADTTIRLQHIGIYGYSWEDVGGSLARSGSYVLEL